MIVVKVNMAQVKASVSDGLGTLGLSLRMETHHCR